MTLLEGRSALVTGAGRGIGRAIVERFIAEGATVVGVDRDELPAPPGCIPLRYDLSDLDGLPGMFVAAEERVGPISILVNCAAVPGTQGVDDLTAEHLSTVLRINLEAPILLAVSAARSMSERGYGRIVNITSVHGSRGVPGCIAYDTSKAGLNNATRSLAVELAARGVLVNAIAPGFVATRLADLDTPEFRQVYMEHRRLPIGRAAEPAEIAVHAAWLSSAQNSYQTGTVVTIDGAMTATL